MKDLYEKLLVQKDVAEWRWMKRQVESGRCIVVDKKLDLIAVGVAVASDDTNSVSEWINNKLLTKPSIEQIEEWDRDLTKKFSVLVLSPYVLIQE